MGWWSSIRRGPWGSTLRRLSAGTLAVVAFSLAPAADAGRLTSSEHQRLLHGEVVSRPLDLDLPQGEYIGGVSYAIIQAPPTAVMAVLADVSTYKDILPLARDAREIGKQGHDSLVSVVHRSKIGDVTYTMRVRRESTKLVRFWVDKNHPRDLDDAWGYFRAEPTADGGTLLTYAAVMDIGSGITHMLFAEKVRSLAMRTPGLVRQYVHERAPRRVAQSR